MKGASVREARARGEADAAKARLMETADELKARLAPGKLTSDAVQAVKDKSIVMADDTVTAVKDRPMMAAGVVTATALFLARKPLFATVCGLFRSKGKDDRNDSGRREMAASTEGNA
jgi:ElaB/YqjD/DUF883 family membrane-anchored ribosome-binding protein